MSGESLNVEVSHQRGNPLLDRLELDVIIYHIGVGTPKRSAVRAVIASKFNVPVRCVYIRRLITDYGAAISKGRVHIYSSPEKAKEIESDHIIRRNIGSDEKSKEKSKE